MRDNFMNIKNLLAASSLIISIGTISYGSTDILLVQRMLNQLGYKAGPTDGMQGNLTTTAIENFYANIGKTYDGTIDEGELNDLKQAVSEMPDLDFETQKKNGMITTFGNYISPKNMINTNWGSNYYLPSDRFMKNVEKKYEAVHWTITGAFANLNGDDTPDLVLGFELHNQCRGNFQVDGNLKMKRCQIHKRCYHSNCMRWVAEVEKT